MFDAVVLAGGGAQDKLAGLEGAPNKSFIRVGGKPMLSYILNALQQAPSVNKLIVVGPLEELAALKKSGYQYTIVPEKGSMLDNAYAGLQEADQGRLCLITSADIPLVTAEMLESFFELCKPLEYDFYYPIIAREHCEKRFPDIKRTYVRLRDGMFTGGNVILLNPSWFAAQRHRLAMFVNYRKKPLNLFRLMPVSFIFKFLSRRLTISDLEQYLSQLMNVKARAVLCPYAEIGTDVDKKNDLAALRCLEGDNI